MKIFKNILNMQKVIIAVFFAIAFIIPGVSFAATLTSNETVANATLGTDDQTDATATTTANVVEVKATRTLTVGSAPTNNQTFTIGACAVTFATTTLGVGTEDLNCSGGATILTTTATASDTPRTTTQIATQIKLLTGITDTGHGALSVAASSTSVTSAVFTTSGTETASTTITYTPGTAGGITSTASTAGTVPVALVRTVTIDGTIEQGDIFTVTLPTVGAVSYTVLSTDTTAANVATGLNAAIQASSDYSSQAFTSVASTNTVVLTAKVAGTGFIQTSSTTNRAAAAQVVTFTPSDPASERFNISINGVDARYDASDTDGINEIVEGLVAAINNGAVSCTEDNTKVTCTSTTAGTAFIYDSGVNSVSSSHSGGHSGGGGGGSSHKDSSDSDSEKKTTSPSVSTTATTVTAASLQAQIAQLIAQIQSLSGGTATISGGTMLSGGVDLTIGSTGQDVWQLQQFLVSEAKGPAALALQANGTTQYFGALSKAALMEYQASVGISPATGYFGPVTRSYLMAHGH